MGSYEDASRELAAVLGLNEAETRVFVEGRDGPAPSGDGFDTFTAGFRAMGMSESAAKAAAVGRDGSEREARRAFAETAEPVSAATDARLSSAIAEAATVAGRVLKLDEAAARKHVVGVAAEQFDKLRGGRESRVSETAEYVKSYKIALSETARPGGR